MGVLSGDSRIARVRHRRMTDRVGLFLIIFPLGCIFSDERSEEETRLSNSVREGGFIHRSDRGSFPDRKAPRLRGVQNLVRFLATASIEVMGDLVDHLFG